MRYYQPQGLISYYSLSILVAISRVHQYRAKCESTREQWVRHHNEEGCKEDGQYEVLNWPSFRYPHRSAGKSSVKTCDDRIIHFSIVIALIHTYTVPVYFSLQRFQDRFSGTLAVSKVGLYCPHYARWVYLDTLWIARFTWWSLFVCTHLIRLCIPVYRICHYMQLKVMSNSCS